MAGAAVPEPIHQSVPEQVLRQNGEVSPEDFVKALENFDEFIDTPIQEVKDSGKDYPVGVGALGIKVYFMHYKSFAEAIEKWNERKQRINKNNMGVMLSNYAGGGTSC